MFNEAVVFEVGITVAIADSSHSIDATATNFFLLTMKDVCWDMTLTAPIMSASEYDLYLWDSDSALGVQGGGVSDVITI